MAATTGGPMVRLGTKWPSITSTCSKSACGATASMASASAAKSADRIEGAMRTTPRTLSRRAQSEDVHAVGAAGLWKKAGASAGRIPWRVRRLKWLPLRMGRGQPRVELNRLGRRERADAVDE